MIVASSANEPHGHNGDGQVALDRIKACARDLKTYVREGNGDTLKQNFHLNQNQGETRIGVG